MYHSEKSLIYSLQMKRQFKECSFETQTWQHNFTCQTCFSVNLRWQRLIRKTHGHHSHSFSDGHSSIYKRQFRLSSYRQIDLFDPANAITTHTHTHSMAKCKQMFFFFFSRTRFEWNFIQMVYEIIHFCICNMHHALPWLLFIRCPRPMLCLFCFQSNEN